MIRKFSNWEMKLRATLLESRTAIRNLIKHQLMESWWALVYDNLNGIYNWSIYGLKSDSKAWLIKKKDIVWMDSKNYHPAKAEGQLLIECREFEPWG